MKKIVLIIAAAFLIMTGVAAQNVDDALRYSQTFYGGTARFMSMGGAFTALGGDISTLSQNPAGLGVFRASEITITPQLFHLNTKASYNGRSYNDYLDNFNLGQIGLVTNLVSNNTDKGLISLNLAYSYNKTANFNQNILIKGVSNTSSIADYWAALGDKTYYKDLGGAEGMAFDAWVVDTITGTGGRYYGTAFNNYGDDPSSTYGQTVRRLVSNEGKIGEHEFALGGNYSNKLFFGVTFGITKLDYTSHYEHLEATDKDLASKIQDFTYTDHYEDSGTGYNIKLGLIFKPVETVRIGLAYHSPTWYKIDEYYNYSLTSRFTDTSVPYEFSSEPSRFNYALTTPSRFLAGVGVQIQKVALLSADYEYVNYGSARFSETGDGYDYSDKNSEISNTLKSASNIRLGGEYRLNNIYMRAGYGYYGKAFKSDEDNANLNYNSISVGAGFRAQNFLIDFAYTNYQYSQKYFLYPVNTGVDPALANLSMVRNMFTLTLGYKFGI